MLKIKDMRDWKETFEVRNVVDVISHMDVKKI
jgi:hypothetical protein